MSNLKNELSYENFEQSIDFIFEENVKKLYTSLPGIIQSYDLNTKRAKVLPAIKRLFTDNSTRSLPVIIDVPIITPSGGGYLISMPLKKGDTVLLIFSQRGITNFKKQYQEALPTDSLLDLHDAIGISGFGTINITPASSDGLSIQTDNGDNAIIVEDDKVVIKKGNNSIELTDDIITIVKGNNSIELTDDNIENKVGTATLTLTSSGLSSNVPITAPEVTVNGIALSTHIHGGVEPGAGVTDSPQ